MLKDKAVLIKLLVVCACLILPQKVNALETSLNTSVNLTATSIFSIEFYVDQNVIYSTTVPFSNIDPTETLVYPNTRSENDGKSDTGVVCISNLGVPWHLQIQGRYSEGLPENSLKFYYSQPWNRNTGEQTSGGLTYNAQWLAMPEEGTTIYTSGSEDTLNTPFGTLSTFSFAVDPRGLSSERTYTVSVTYTMTTTP
jgi:hypothetical protein